MSKFILNLFYVCVLSCGLLVVGCGNDDDEVSPSDTPSAKFEFTVNELTVDFSNSSTGASTYSWDFGDGNTSTEADPTHTYAEAGSYEVALTATNGSLTNTATQTVAVMLDPENVRKKSGYVVLAQTEDDSYLAQYFEELPTGTVDITQGTAFQTLFPLSVQDGAIFTTRTDGSAGFAKIGINGRNEFVEDGIISTVSGESFSLRTRDADFGVFHDRSNPDVLNTFNPTTMEVTGSIDMSAANALTEDPVRYQTYIFRGDNEIFVPTRLEAGGNVPDIALPKIDIAAGAVTDIPVFEDLGDVVVFNRFGQRYVDEAGDLYFYHGGNISLPTISGAVVKIAAGANDYDMDYYFPVPEINNPALTGQGTFLSTFYYYKDDIGFALINEELDQQIIDLVIERGGVENFTDEDFQMVLFWLFTSPTGAWVQVDMMTKDVTKINGLPPLSPFDASNMSFVGNTPHFAIANPSVNAFYRLDEATGSAEKVFDVTGANIVGVFDLSINE